MKVYYLTIDNGIYHWKELKEFEGSSLPDSGYIHDKLTPNSNTDLSHLSHLSDYSDRTHTNTQNKGFKAMKDKIKDILGMYFNGIRYFAPIIYGIIKQTIKEQGFSGLIALARYIRYVFPYTNATLFKKMSR